MEKVTYGLQIWTETEHRVHYVNVEVMQRENDGDRPLGISSNDRDRAYRDNEPKHLVGLQMQGLGMYGFVSGEYCGSAESVRFIGHDIEYRNVFSVGRDDAARMVKTFKVIAKRLAADDAHDAGDMFASLCAALKLSWVCEKTETSPNGRFSQWRFMTVGKGRNRYRRLIDEAIAAARAETFGATERVA